ISKGIWTPRHVAYQRPRGGSKKHALSLPEGSVQQGRSHFCPQSVLPVRQHGKMARTPLAAFFNSPTVRGNGGSCGTGSGKKGVILLHNRCSNVVFSGC